ncbi:MAG TPA: SRPBCC domain-containing protein [Candidatus Polarisedimenticolaceae bacterium]
MTFQPEPGTIRWKMHFASPPEAVYDALATPAGRERYWAESSPEAGDTITFHILGYPPFSGGVLRRDPPRRFALEYFGTRTEFSLAPDGKGGTDLTLVAREVDASMWDEMLSGWVSVLMAMKAAVDHGVDLRNHDPERTWQHGYADN